MMKYLKGYPIKNKIALNIIFHKNIYDELYGDLKRHKDKLIFIGVRDRIPAKSRLFNIYKILYESELPKYSPALERKGYKETTAIYHAYTNKIYVELDYIGFAQADMFIGDEVFDIINAKIAENRGKRYIFYMEKVPMECEYGLTWVKNFDDPLLSAAIASYNKYFGTNYAEYDILRHPPTADSLILYSTFIIPVDMFEKIMGWLVSFIKETETLVEQKPKDFMIAHVMERMYGLALSLELFDNKTELVHVPIRHIRGYDPDPLMRFRLKTKNLIKAVMRKVSKR